MRSNPDSKLVLSITRLATQSAQKYFEAEQAQIVKDARQADRVFAQKILSLAAQAKSVEELVVLEKTLQNLDLLKAKSEQDRRSIRAAQKSYEQFTTTLGLMRKTPGAYFTANMGHKDSGGDPKTIVRGNSLDFIEGNITRMRNREAFAPEGEREVWTARIAAAKRTGDLFKELHDGFAGNFGGEQ